MTLNARALIALENFRPRPETAYLVENAFYRDRLVRQILAFPSYALPSSANPSCIAGLVHEFGVGELWMLTGENFERDARRILPLARRLLAHLYSSLGLHRMCMRIAVDNLPGQRWAKHTGFQWECGPMKRAGARGEDLDMWFYKSNNEGK